MSSNPSARRLTLLFVAPLTVAFSGAVLILLATNSGSADAGSVLRANSVCEAHELKAKQADDPHIQIEIAAEYDREFPTREACLSHAAAADPDTPGLVQPIEFSHKHHAGTFQIDCHYCHSGTDRSPSAGVPSVEVCMGCHAQFPAEYDELAGIRTLKDHWRDKAPIEWEQIHRLPEYVQFKHNRHVAAGVECQRCHGAVEEMDKVVFTEDTVWWPWLLPSRKLEMGWCVQCHRENDASQDCYTCHY